jgi:hypothetical protein
MTTFHRVAETWLVDLAAALFTGFAIWWLLDSMAWPDSLFDSAAIQRLTVKLLAFLFPALMLSLWKHRLRILWGWAVIAILGIVLTSVVDEMVYRATATPQQLSFMPAFSPFPLEIVIMFWPALFIMAAAHYIGRLVVRFGATQQIVAREPR